MRGSFANWEDELDVTLRAGAPIVWLDSDEEPRAIAAIERSSARAQRSVTLWSCARGLHPLRSSAVDTRTQDPLAALDAFARMDARAVLVLLDVAPFLTQALVARRLREAPSSLASQGKAIVMVGAGPCPLAELRAESARVVAAPPTSEELARVARALAPTLQEDAVRAIVTAAKGLRADAFALALRRAIVRFDPIDHRAIEEVRREGARAIHDGALLEPIDTDASLDRLGGLDALKRWLDLRARALTDEARSFGVDAPRGVFVVGVQGGGKSTCARAVAARWGLPLLRFDIGRVFHGIVGASEANVRRALAQAESSAPCVLWLDEVNRGLSDVSGRGDSGISGRVFATLLTWLQDRDAPVFVVATANDVSALPPELLRKGRFDEVFFVDLPTRVERSEIARIHLARRGRATDEFDLDALADACEAFSGAEIEQCVVTALLYAFSEGRPLAQADIVRAARETVPLAKTARESVEALRRWAQGRARPASSMRDAIDHRVVL